MALRTARALAGVLLIALASGCEAGEAPSAEPEPAPRAAAGPLSVPVTLAGEVFHLELAADPARRHLGLGGRRHIPANSGMLFAFRRVTPREFLMRDCRVPLDIAFLDASGRVTAIHTMSVEPPRRAGESGLAYEARLPLYGSGAPSQFVVETAAGRLADLGLRVGDAVEFDRAAVLRDTR